MKSDNKIFFALEAAEWDKVMSNIVLKHSNYLLSRITKLVKSRFDAEEILQDVFLDAWNRQHEFRAEPEVVSFLRSRSYYRSLDFLRKKIPSTVEIDDVVNVFKDMSSAADSNCSVEELTLQVMLTVEKMPEQRKKVFTMSRLDGKSRGEIASALDIEPRTVSNHLHMALTELKKILLLSLFVFIMA